MPVLWCEAQISFSLWAAPCVFLLGWFSPEQTPDRSSTSSFPPFPNLGSLCFCSTDSQWGERARSGCAAAPLQLSLEKDSGMDLLCPGLLIPPYPDFPWIHPCEQEQTHSKPGVRKVKPHSQPLQAEPELLELLPKYLPEQQQRSQVMGSWNGLSWEGP